MAVEVTWVKLRFADTYGRCLEGLSTPAVGAATLLYLRSLMEKRPGYLPNDDAFLASICRLSLDDFLKVKTELTRSLFRANAKQFICEKSAQDHHEVFSRLSGNSEGGRKGGGKNKKSKDVPEQVTSKLLPSDYQVGSNDRRIDGRTERTKERKIEPSKEGTNDPEALRGLRDSPAPPNGSTTQTDLLDEHPSRPSVSVHAPGSGFASPRDLVSGTLDRRHAVVGAALETANLIATGNRYPKSNKPPDAKIIERIIEASHYAEAAAIERVLLANAKDQGKREIDSWPYWESIVRTAFGGNAA